MSDQCLHCGGTGTEPFSDGEQCRICLGEQAVPDVVNREYYDRIQSVLEGGDPAESDREIEVHHVDELDFPDDLQEAREYLEERESE